MRTLFGFLIPALALCFAAGLCVAQDKAPAADTKPADEKTDQPAKTDTAKDDARTTTTTDTKAADTKADDAKSDTAKTETAKDTTTTAAAGDTATEPPPVTCTVKSVSGTVEWRPNKDAEWEGVKEGQDVPLGADVCTGFRAKCMLVFVDESSAVELQPLTIMRIGEFQREGNKVRTRIYVMQGAARTIVEKSRFESDFAIVTPEVTLAVRGTKVIELKQHSDTGPKISLSQSGRITVTDNKTKRSKDLKPKDTVKRGLASAIQNVKFGSTVPVFDMHGGLTRNEQFSVMSKSFTTMGTPNQNAPNGGNPPGGGNPRRTGQSNEEHETIIIHEWECE